MCLAPVNKLEKWNFVRNEMTLLAIMIAILGYLSGSPP